MHVDGWKDKEVLVIGGAGMIGSTVASMAVQEGASVTVLDAMLPLYGGNMFNLEEIRDAITFVREDIRNEAALREIVKGKDVVFNLAAQVSYVRSNKDPLLDLDINCRGIINVLEACKESAPAAKILFSSSRFVYGAIEHNPVDEKHPFNCLSVYGIHKLTGEKYHKFYHDAYGLDTVSLRIANPYGPRQQMKHSEWGIVNWFIRLAMDSKPLTVYGTGSQKRDYVFVEDIARAFLAAASSPKTKGEVYNVGAGVGTAFMEMAHAIASMIPGTVVQQIEWPADRYFVETGDYISDIRKVQKDVAGWSPEVPFLEGVRRTVEYYNRHRKHYWIPQ